MAINYILKAIG